MRRKTRRGSPAWLPSMTKKMQNLNKEKIMGVLKPYFISKKDRKGVER